MVKRSSFSWVHPSLAVKKISYGKGLFALKSIKKGTILVIFGGYVIPCTEEQKMPPPLNDFAHQISPGFVIGIKRKSQIQPADYINHSCSPNAGFKGQIFLVAMRSISAGEEITFDYCMVLSKSKGVLPTKFTCKCGSRECRTVITCSDWRNLELQRKYKGYFQWYLEEKISRHNYNRKEKFS